jgi:DNA polymerase epsilon subunit 2
MLTEYEDGKLCLEDPDGWIALEIDQHLQQGTGLFIKNCFVLAQGEYTKDGNFRVDVLGMPPPESRDDSLYRLLM